MKQEQHQKPTQRPMERKPFRPKPAGNDGNGGNGRSNKPKFGVRPKGFVDKGKQEQQKEGYVARNPFEKSKRSVLRLAESC